MGNLKAAFDRAQMAAVNEQAELIDGASCPWPRQPRAGFVQGVAWYLLQARSNAENALREFLKRYGYEVYYPKALLLRQVPKAQLSRAQRAQGDVVRRPTLVPLFPSYPFIRFDIADYHAHALFDLAGVYGLHCAGGERPVVIDDAYVAQLRRLEQNGVLPASTLVKDLFAVGERVRVATGPFAHFSGVIEELPKDLRDQLAAGTIAEVDESLLVKVAVQIFGRSTPVSMPLSAIEKL
jgi:transcriptional antiterminator NusG